MKQIKKGSTIGIWGFGIVGKAALKFLHNKNCSVEILDNRILTTAEKTEVKNANGVIVPPSKRTLFLQHNDIIVPSPGVDLRPYKKYQSKWLSELDIIQHEFHKPIVAITGTAGKTTVTHLLSDLLRSCDLRVWTGGNIGTGMLDLVREQNNVDLAVLEVSSFQLEYCKIFAPTIAIWTNFFPNHLDRHGTMDDYFAAKKNIVAHQKQGQHAIVSESVFKKLGAINSSVMLVETEKKLPVAFEKLKILTFQENLIAISHALDIISDLFDIDFLKKVNIASDVIRLPSHRLENLGTKKGVTFYNDSKSTTPASTVAAIKKLSNRPILLLLGGLSKGTSREQLITDIKKYVKKIYAFGAETETIRDACQKHRVPYSTFKNLDAAVAQSVVDAQSGDQILLSPAGSSFDLFKTYEERGDCFKRLVKQLVFCKQGIETTGNTKQLTRKNRSH